MIDTKCLAVWALLGAGLGLPEAVLAQHVPAQEERSAQQPGDDDADSDRIVVTGRAEGVNRSEITRQARDIAQGGNIYDTPLARFEDRLCPGISGLRPDAAALMIDRIRDNAADFAIRLADDGCSPNFIVVFTSDSEAMLRTILADQPWRFDKMDPAEKRAMLAPGPVHVFSRVEPRTRDGMIVPDSPSADPPVLETWMAHSKIYTAVRNDITQVMVFFSSEAVKGMTLTQLADYAVMRGLAQTEPGDDPAAMDSILALFEPDGAPPEMLTRFDRAYLRSLYNSIPNLPAIAKLNDVNRQLRRLREEEEAGEEERDAQE